MKPFVTTAIVIGVVVVLIVIYLCFSYRFNYLFKSWYILLQKKYVGFPVRAPPERWSPLLYCEEVGTETVSLQAPGVLMYSSFVEFGNDILLFSRTGIDSSVCNHGWKLSKSYLRQKKQLHSTINRSPGAFCSTFLADNFVVSRVKGVLIGVGGRDPSGFEHPTTVDFDQGAYQFKGKVIGDNVQFDEGSLIIRSSIGAPQSHLCSNEVFTPIVEGCDGIQRIYSRYNINIAERKLQMFWKTPRGWEFGAVVMIYDHTFRPLKKYSVYSANVVCCNGMYVAMLRFTWENNPCFYGTVCEPTLASSWHIRAAFSLDGVHFILQEKPVAMESTLFPAYGCYSEGMNNRWCFMFNRYNTKELVRKSIVINPIS